ncbi:MAG: ABC transporter permease [Oligoflexus sp.]|nr:ABC transporter permease [Oligoflexus sp.]
MAFEKNLRSLTRPLSALILGAFVSAILIRIVGESPWKVAEIFYNGAMGSAYDLGLSLFYTVPLILTGLAVSVGLRARLFNIGVEGQLTVAALAAALAGIWGPQDVILNRVLGFAAALLGGFLWGAILGYLKARRQAHEVVAGIMLNFIAYGITSWLALNFFKNPDSQNPETIPLIDAVRIPAWSYFQSAPIGWHVLLAPLAAMLLWGFYRWTEAGWAMEAVGENPKAAREAGLSIAQKQFWALAMGGMIAGIVGFIEVYGNSGKFIVGFSPAYGFMGIAVALVGRLHPFGIILSAALFGAIHKGSLDLDFETEWITRDFAQILQAVLILFMSCATLVPAGIQNRWEGLKRRLYGQRP